MHDHRLTGIVRKFDPQQPYGFLMPIEPALIQGDILMHERSLFGCSEAAVPGARVECLVRQKSPDRRRVIRVFDCLPPCGLVRAWPECFDEGNGTGLLKDGSGREISVGRQSLSDAGWTPEAMMAMPSLFAIVADIANGWHAIALYPDRHPPRIHRKYRRRRSKPRSQGPDTAGT
jgi:hypothetical protein